MDNHTDLFKSLIKNTFPQITYLQDSQSDWQGVLSLCEYASMEYLISAISYHNAYLLTAKDCSFVIYENNTPVAIWPLTLYQNDNTITLQSNCKPIIPPVFIGDTTKKVIKKVYQQCFELLQTFSLQFNNSVTLAYSPIDDVVWQRTFSPAIKEINYQQYLIADISKSMVEIKKSFRKSYRSLINKGNKLWSPQLHTNMSDHLLDEFRTFHIQTAGRDTKPLSAWKILQKMVNGNEAFCITLYNESNHLIAIAFFNHSPLQACYSVGVYDRSLFDLPLGHVIQFKAIEYMKTLGIRRYFLGNRHHLFEKIKPTEKESSIGFFKEGFSNSIYIEANASLAFS